MHLPSGGSVSETVALMNLCVLEYFVHDGGGPSNRRQVTSSQGRLDEQIRRNLTVTFCAHMRGVRRVVGLRRRQGGHGMGHGM